METYIYLCMYMHVYMCTYVYIDTDACIDMHNINVTEIGNQTS